MSRRRDNFKIPNTIIIRDRKEYVSMKKFLQARGSDFKIKQSGTIERLFHRDKEYIFLTVSKYAGKGYHLSKVVRKDVENWLEHHKSELKSHNSNYKTQAFNLLAIEKRINNPMVGVDVNDCYWRTAFTLGYITERTFVIGKRKKEWKIGRNASIGALAKTIIEISYVNGKTSDKLKKITYAPDEYQWIRNHIIKHVYKLFWKLKQEIGEQFCMFLTDCVYTDYDKLEYIKEFFLKHGYKVKTKPIEFIEVDRVKQIVRWKDFGASIEKRNKYYMYAKHQLIV